MDFFIATHVRSFEELKEAASRLETYNAEGKWLVIGEDSPASLAFLKAWSVKRQVTSYFLPLDLARKISQIAFFGPSGALNGALLCSAITDTPVFLFRNGAFPVSKEIPKILEVNADAISGCCSGFSRNPHAWIDHAQSALAAWKTGVISKEFCIKQVREAFVGNALAEKSVCTDSLCVKPNAAKRVCFPPKTDQAILLWIDVAERMGLHVAEGKHPWSSHAQRLEDMNMLKTVLKEYEKLQAIANAVDYVFKKTSLQTYSDYLLDEACQVTLTDKCDDAVFGPELADGIRSLKDKELTVAAENLKPENINKKNLRDEGRAFFSSLKNWPEILETAREKEIIRFVE